ncbi:MAG: hypothetical protein H6683_08115 [Deltaproteobacteria bacterium]|nr:hypothetical protein [Deltaproteobacteria bacterium]
MRTRIFHPMAKIAIFLALALILATAAGCKETLSEDDLFATEQAHRLDDEPSVSALSPPCPAGVIPRGFGYSWQTYNHRLSFWQNYLEPPECREGAVEKATYHVGLIGGNWSTGKPARDAQTGDFRYQVAVDVPETWFAYAHVTLDMHAPEHRAEQRALFTLSEPMLGAKHITAVLAGFEFRTDVPQKEGRRWYYDPALGYTFRGIGAGVEEVRREEGKLAMNVWSRFLPGKADRLTMNAAMDHATTQMTVLILVIASNEARFTQAEHAFEHVYAKPKFLREQNLPPIPEDKRHFEVDVAPDLPTYAIGMQSFDFSLFTDSQAKGDYMRALHAALETLSYDEGTGKMVVDADLYASNASRLTIRRLFAAADVGLLVAQWPGGTVWDERYYKEREVPAQAVELPLSPGEKPEVDEPATGETGSKEKSQDS